MLVGRLQALQCAAIDAMQEPEQQVMLTMEQVQGKRARCAACTARICTCGTDCACRQCTCTATCACRECECEACHRGPAACADCDGACNIRICVSGDLGTADFCGPINSEWALPAAAAKYTVTACGAGKTVVSRIQVDDCACQAACDNVAVCEVDDNASTVRVQFADGSKIEFGINCVSVDDRPSTVIMVAPRFKALETVVEAAGALSCAGLPAQRSRHAADRCGQTPGGDVPGELAALSRKLACAQKAAAAVRDFCTETTTTADSFVPLLAPAELVVSHSLRIATSAQATALHNTLQTLRASTADALAHTQAVEAGEVGPDTLPSLLPRREAERVGRLATLRGSVLSALAPGPGVSPALGSQPARAESDGPAHLRRAGARIAATVDRRAHYITLAGLDAALRARVACIEGAEQAAPARDAAMCAYQLRQVMATDAQNDVKLSAGVFEHCLAMAIEARDLAAQPLEPDACLQSAAPAVRALRAAKVLEAVEAAASTRCAVAPGANYEYRRRDWAADRHEEAGSPAAEARTALAAMADADLRHRVISPLVHKCVRAACAGKASVPVADVVNAFAEDVRPLARLALGGEAPKACEDPYAFLGDASVRTGYNDEHKTRLLVKLMFGAGA